jgi:acylphosphatase
MSELAAAQAIVRGRVQGVNFRYFVERHATALHLTGYVRNLPGGNEVEVRAEGTRADVAELIDRLRTGSPRARVDRVDVSWSEYSGLFNGFGVRY